MTAPTYTSTSAIARNSASVSSHSAALCTNASTRNNAECTGLRVVMTPSAAHDQHGRKRVKQHPGNQDSAFLIS